MKMKHSPHNGKRGSVLSMILIFGSLLLLTTAVLLRYGVTEKVINEHHFLRLESQNAAESMVEYGFAELKDRWLNKTSFSLNELKESPIDVPTTALNFYENSNISPDSLEIVGGLVPPGTWRYIDPDDPANQMDPQKEKLVFARDVRVYGKATIDKHLAIGPKRDLSAFASQILQVRDSPLFGHAIFYNMDLEFHPGPFMEVIGPVHSNEDIYVQSGGGIKFHSTLMAAGDIYHSYKKDEKKSNSHLDYVKIRDASGNWKEMYVGSGDKKAQSSYYDSLMGKEWKSAAESQWGGMVGSKAHEVPRMKPLNIEDYVPDDPNTSENELRNPAYALIEPQLPKGNSNYKGLEVQKEQFSYQAGLVLRIIEDATKPEGYRYKFFTYEKTDPRNPNSERILRGNGMPRETRLKTGDLPEGLLTFEKYEENPDGSIKSGFYDRRQLQTMDVVELDIGLLRSTVDSTAGNFDPNAWKGSYNLDSTGDYDWNGIMYIEIPDASSGTTRPDKVHKAKEGIAVRIKNGSKIPSPPGSIDPGFTLATNAPLYISGNYNADGNSSTGSATQPDDSAEKPAALIADSITILSSNWEANDYDSKSKNSVNDRKADFTEVSAAFLTGQSPTIPNSDNFSGGVHNFPRFLESWSGKEFRYRGSLVALFESEVNWRHMRSDFGSWYSPPKRNWGFSTIFAGGNYPPGTPNVRDFRRKHFQFISEEDYTFALSRLD